jgi:hypothetical protein
MSQKSEYNLSGNVKNVEAYAYSEGATKIRGCMVIVSWAAVLLVSMTKLFVLISLILTMLLVRVLIVMAQVPSRGYWIQVLRKEKLEFGIRWNLRPSDSLVTSLPKTAIFIRVHSRAFVV